MRLHEMITQSFGQTKNSFQTISLNTGIAIYYLILWCNVLEVETSAKLRLSLIMKNFCILFESCLFFELRKKGQKNSMAFFCDMKGENEKKAWQLKYVVLQSYLSLSRKWANINNETTLKHGFTSITVWLVVNDLRRVQAG